MVKKDMKGVVIAVILLIAVGFVLQTTGILGSLQSAVTPKPCDEAPYASNCVCMLDEEQLSVRAFGLTKYVCEVEDKFVDPKDSGWETQAIAYAEQKLAEEFPDCDMNTCSQGEWVVVAGWRDYEQRIISVECWNIDQRFAIVTFALDDGEIIDMVSCADYRAPPVGQPYIDIWSEEGENYWLIPLKFKVHCTEGTGTAIGEYTHNMPESASDVSKWWMHGEDDTFRLSDYVDSACVLTDKTSDSVTVSCTAECTGYGDHGGDLGLLRYE